MRVFVLCVGILAIAACKQAPAGHAAVTKAEAATIAEQAEANFTTGKVDDVMRQYAEGAVLFDAGHPTLSTDRKVQTGWARDFVSKVYLPDVLAVASFYKDWAGVGGGVGNYMVYGEYPETDDDKPPLFLPSGIIRNRNLGKVEPLDPAKITESVKRKSFCTWSAVQAVPSVATAFGKPSWARATTSI